MDDGALVTGRKLKELMQQLDEGKNVDAGVQYNMPKSSYVCPELAAKEWGTLFRGHPQLIGLSGELPESGSFLTLDNFWHAGTRHAG